MFLSDHGKFSIINPKLIFPNNEKKPFISKQLLIRYYNDTRRLIIQQFSTAKRYDLIQFKLFNFLQRSPINLKI